MSAGDLVERAIRAARAGKRWQAQALLTQALRQDPRQASAWLWLAACLDDPERQRYCLEKALALEPDNPHIRQALEEPADSPAVAENEGEPQDAPGSTIPATEAVRRHRSPVAALLALAVVAGLAAVTVIVLPGMTGRAIDWDRLGGSLGLSASWLASDPQPETPDPPAAPATLALALPPTWTPAPSTERFPTPTLLPTQDGSGQETADPTPLPSITPLAGHRLLIIGRSVQKRAIEVYRFGSGRRERMIVAGIHGGDEHNTIELADALIEHLGRNPDAIPKGYTLYLLRALNPDGDAAGRDPENRLNANGVDLNRNFDTNWKSTWRSDGCASLPGAAGSAPGSEPETQAVKEFLREREIEALIVYHSAGLGVFPSGDPPHPGSVRLAQAIAGISDYAYPPVDTGCEYTGTLVDWAANAGIPAAVDLELNSATDAEFDDNLKVLELLLAFDVQR
jgi:hypothetical protein